MYHFFHPTTNVCGLLNFAVQSLFKLRNVLANPLPGLPLIGLSVLERKPTRPLVCARLPADLAVAARKQNTPQCNECEEPGAEAAQAERRHTRLRPQAVAIKGVGCVEEGGDGEGGKRIGGFGVGVLC